MRNQSLAALWIDLSRLKQVNESFGHMGGDEFVCLIPHCDAERARQLAQDLLQAIETPLRFGELFLHPSASIGIAVLEADEDPFVFLERADRAMGTAKHHDAAVIATPSITPPLTSRYRIAMAQLAEHLVQRHSGLSHTHEWPKPGAACLHLLEIDESRVDAIFADAAPVLDAEE